MKTNIITLNEITDDRGTLTFTQNPQIPFEVKRIYYLTHLNEKARGFHAHKNLKQIAICLQGSCKIKLVNQQEEIEIIKLSKSNQALLIDTLIWHEMFDFSPDCIFMVLASDVYDESDYLRDYASFLTYRKSNTVHLELAKVSDADFILSLRTNPDLNKYISQVSNDIQAQIDFLTKYKQKEANQEEFYFIVKRNTDNQECGTVRLYNIDYVKGVFEWGSFILNENKTSSASLEVALLTYQFAFETLKLKEANFEVNKLNHKAIKFHQKLDATFIKENEINLYFSFNYQQFLALKNKWNKYAI